MHYITLYWTLPNHYLNGLKFSIQVTFLKFGTKDIHQNRMSSKAFEIAALQCCSVDSVSCAVIKLKLSVCYDFVELNKSGNFKYFT